MPSSFKEYHFAEVTRVTTSKLTTKLRGAVFFKSNTLTHGTEYPIPAEPSFPVKGQFYVPKVGEQIEVEIDTGTEHVVPKYMRYVYSDVEDIDEEFKTNYPNRQGFVTPIVRHKLIFDETTGQRLVRWVYSQPL